MFKIALVGTHGVNKTTIAYELAGVLKRRGKTVELLTEIARESPFPLNEQATREAYQWIIAKQIQLEIEKLPRAEILVCDRAVLDNFAYYIRRFSNTGYECEALHAYCRSWMKSYDLLVRLPIIHELTSDGFRSTDVNFQREIDALCDELFEGEYHERSKPAYFRGLMTADEIADLILQKRAAAI
jgi:nicotinamide riboside kinase